MEQYFTPSEQDQRTRKLWLRWTVLLNFILPFIFYFFMCVVLPEEPEWLALFAIFILLSVIFLFLYCCAYLSPGTRLLTFFIVVQQICIVISLIGLIGGAYSGKAVVILELSILARTLWMLRWDLKLRKINKLIQVQEEGYRCTEFQQALSLMKNSLSLEVLDKGYLQLVEKWPQWLPSFSSEYNRKKEELDPPSTDRVS